MERSRYSRDIFDLIKAKLADLQSQINTLKNQNVALPDWQAPTLVNSWVNFGGVENNAGYWRSSNGLVILRGVISTGTIGTVAFTLPVGFRPLGNRRFAAISAGAVSGYILVAANGQVTISAGTNTWIDLASVMFRAEQ